jgi:hypothetical protein
MLTAITPTGDRLHQFAICYELMMRQTVKPDRWIIVDDGVQKLEHIVNGKINNMEIIVVRRKASPDRITLKENILAALEKININDKVIFFEDDDFYPDTYIEAMSQLLVNYIVVGGLLRKYYNLTFKGYWEFTQLRYGTLSSTAFNTNGKTLNIFREVCSNGYGHEVDIEFWRKIKSEGISNFLHSDARAQVIGVKGWNIGRKGAVLRTHMKKRRKYIYDTNFKNLKCYFDNFSEKYKSFIKRGFLIDLLRPTIGVYYRFRAFLKCGNSLFF